MFGKGSASAAGNQYANVFANMDDVEDDFQDEYGSNYYDEEDPSMDSAIMRHQYAQQQKQAIAQQMMGQKSVPAYTGPGSQPIGSNLYSGGQQFGQNVMSFGAQGGTQFGANTLGGGSGGFSYGMASAGGSLFGQPAQNAPLGQKPVTTNMMGGLQKPATGGFAFGSASQFGAIGQSNTGAFGNSNAMPSSSNDPYANIDLDLSKVKSVNLPAKPFEKKSEEEKVEDAKLRGAQRSSLKTTKEDFDKAALAKKEVRFGKSITYQVEGDSEPSVLVADSKATEGQKVKTIIDERDLSDGRDEKERIKELLEQEEKRQLEEMKSVNEWKQKQDKLNKVNNEKKPVTVPKSSNYEVEESGVSSSVGASKKPENVGESYTSDDFEDTSMSGSGSASNSGQISKIITQNQKNAAAKSQPVSTLKKIEESSDVYEDDEFESLSRSQQQMNQILPIPVKKLPTIQNTQQKTTVLQVSSQLQAQTKKENQTTMTEVGKYNYSSDPTSGALTMKEMSLKRQLDDSELVTQQQRIDYQQLKDDFRQLELKFKQKDTEFQGARRDALNANETAKRMQEQLKELQHRNNLYRVETEELIRQIDLADAKTREKEDILTLKEAEFERAIRLHEERLLFRRGKGEEREILDLRREHAIQLDELKQKLDEKIDENDYLSEKVAKLELTNKELRLSKDPKAEMKKLENELEYLRQQVQTYQKQDSTKGKVDTSTVGIKKELTLEEQVRIQRDLAQSDLIIKGYQEENQKAESKLKDVTSQLRQREKELNDLKRQLHEVQIKKMVQTDKVFVEQQNEEVDLQTANLMGPSASISQKQLKEMQESVMNLRNENDSLKRDWNLKEQQLKTQMQKVRNEKTQLEKQLYETEYLVSEKNSEIQKSRDTWILERGHLEDQIKELTSKVAWFRENQSLLTDQEQQIQCQKQEITDLKVSLKKSEEERLKQKDFEKRCKLLEETIKSKNPNSIPMLIQATSDLAAGQQDNQGEKQLKFRIQQLEGEMDEKDKDFERRIRTLRQEQERMKQIYENRAGNPAEARKVNELEQEVQRVKTYYQKRIRELEDKYKFKVNMGKVEEGLSDLIETKPPAKSSAREGAKHNDSEQVQKLTEDRNMLAARLVESQKKIESLQQRIDQLESEKALLLQRDNVKNEPSQNSVIPIQRTQQNPKLNPFFVEEKQVNIKVGRSVPEILKILQSHSYEIQDLKDQILSTTELKEVLGNLISDQELRSLVNHLKESKNDEDNFAQDVDGSVVDMNELLELIGSVSPGRPTSEKDTTKTKDLKRELLRLQREKEDDNDFLNQKIRQLRRQLQQATSEKEETLEYTKQVEAQKIRLERFLKQSLGKGENSNDDIIQEVNFIMRRLEMLEQQSEERTKSQLGDQQPLKRQVEQLKIELMEERAIKERVIQKFSSEVTYYKKELETLLERIDRKQTKTR